MKKKTLTNNTNTAKTLDDIIEKVEKNLDLYEIMNNEVDQIQSIKDTTMKIVQQISLAEHIDVDLAFISFALLLQSGGYLKGVTNRKILIGDYEFSKKKVILAMKTVKCVYTLRTIARVNREIIAKIAKKMKYPGNLFSQYKVRNPDILKKSEEVQLEHAVYCTDFQRENPSTPEEVLNFLLNREIKNK